ncbi:MAG: OmpA family protein [Ignavibacteriae bacterium]|nr:OmpA family protein [Ignavibacteriota bacterium]
MKYNFLFRFIVIFLFIPLLSFSQGIKDSSELLRHRFGIFGNYNYYLHTADFHQLPEVVICCPTFEKGEGKGYSFGFLYEYLYSSSISAIGRLKYSELSGEMTDDERKSALVDNKPANALIQHFLSTKLTMIGIESLVKIKLIDELSILGGFDFNFIINSHYNQYEKLIQPAVGKFDNGKRIRYEESGVLKEISILNSNLIGGFCYDLSFGVDNNFVISPEISFSYNFTPVVPNLIWNIHSAKAGLSFKYAPAPKKEIIFPEPMKPPTPQLPEPPAEEKKIDFSIKSVIGDSVSNRDEIDIEEFLSTRMNPLLNYIFFDSASSEIPPRYNKLSKVEALNYRIDTLMDKSELETYYDILNIVGKRLSDNPAGSIKLVGCNSNDGIETGNIDLSEKRVKNIAEYFNKVWNIKPTRIKIVAINLPVKYSNSNVPDGSAENRRVEIYSNENSILSPIEINDTINEIKQSELRFIPETNIIKFLDGQLEIEANGKTIKEISFQDYNPDKLVWIMNNVGTTESLKHVNQLNCKMTLRDLDMKTYTCEKPIKINKIRIKDKRISKISDKQINLFSLILYDFDSYTLNDKNIEMLNDVKKTLDKKSIVTFEGYTDKLGDEEYNMLLSVRRAKAAADAIQFENSKYVGFGKTKLLFDNEFPEGRFYSRTVKIRVETPIK